MNMSGPVLFLRSKQKCIEFHDLTEFTIGRSLTCNINVADTSVSRCQCIIKKVPEGEWLILDKSSFKSTFLNGLNIPQCGQYLKSSDLITFSNLEAWQLVFYESKDEVPPSAKRRRTEGHGNIPLSQERDSTNASSARTEPSSTPVAKYKEQCQALTEELEDAVKSKNDLVAEIQRLKEEKDRVDDILIGSHLDSKQLLEELEDCRSELARLAKERDELSEDAGFKECLGSASNPLCSQSSASELESNLIMKTIEAEELKDELQDMKSKVEKLEELLHSLTSRNEKLYTDAVAVLEQEFLCCVCSDLLLEPVTLNCRHTICRDCLNEWKKKKKECPSCRTKIKTEVSPLMVDTFIDRIASLLGEEFQKKREECKRERTAPKPAAAPPAAPTPPPPPIVPPAGRSRGQGRNRGRRTTQRQQRFAHPPAHPPPPHVIPGVIDLTDRSPGPAREANIAVESESGDSQGDYDRAPFSQSSVSDSDDEYEYGYRDDNYPPLVWRDAEEYFMDDDDDDDMDDDVDDDMDDDVDEDMDDDVDDDMVEEYDEELDDADYEE